MQYAWLRLLAGDQDKLMVVGDDDQSIYGWRGARIENIRQFTHDFPNAQTHQTGTELPFYRQYSAGPPMPLLPITRIVWEKSFVPMAIKASQCTCYAGFNEMDEARFITDRIKDAITKGTARSDIAILYRSNAQSRILEEAMLRAAIPYRIYGGQRFFERAEIKNALAYLRLVPLA